MAAAAVEQVPGTGRHGTRPSLHGSTSAETEADTLGDPKDTKRKKHVDAAIDFLGGIAGGTASVYTGQPLDTVKVKMQTFPGSYRHALHCFVITLKEEGIPRGLYAGTVPSLSAQVAENSILFMAYGLCQKGVGWVVGRDHDKLGIPYQALAGSLASIFSSMAICPTELVKCRMQTLEQVRQNAIKMAAAEARTTSGTVAGAKGAELDKALSKAGTTTFQGIKTPVIDFDEIPKHRVGPVEMTRRIFKQEGIPGFYRGFISTVYRDVPSYFFFFGTYELCCDLLTPRGKSRDELGPLRTIFAGGMGGVASWVIGYPFDVVKSRLQVKVLGQQTTTVGLALLIARTEGVGALYKGLGPTLLRTFPATGALFLAYETTKKLLSRAAYGSDDC